MPKAKKYYLCRSPYLSNCGKPVFYIQLNKAKDLKVVNTSARDKFNLSTKPSASKGSNEISGTSHPKQQVAYPPPAQGFFNASPQAPQASWQSKGQKGWNGGQGPDSGEDGPKGWPTRGTARQGQETLNNSLLDSVLQEDNNAHNDNISVPNGNSSTISGHDNNNFIPSTISPIRNSNNETRSEADPNELARVRRSLYDSNETRSSAGDPVVNQQNNNPNNTSRNSDGDQMMSIGSNPNQSQAESNMDYTTVQQPEPLVLSAEDRQKLDFLDNQLPQLSTRINELEELATSKSNEVAALQNELLQRNNQLNSLESELLNKNKEIDLLNQPKEDLLKNTESVLSQVTPRKYQTLHTQTSPMQSPKKLVEIEKSALVPTVDRTQIDSMLHTIPPNEESKLPQPNIPVTPVSSRRAVRPTPDQSTVSNSRAPLMDASASTTATSTLPVNKTPENNKGVVHIPTPRPVQTSTLFRTPGLNLISHSETGLGQPGSRRAESTPTQINQRRLIDNTALPLNSMLDASIIPKAASAKVAPPELVVEIPTTQPMQVEQSENETVYPAQEQTTLPMKDSTLSETILPGQNLTTLPMRDTTAQTPVRLTTNDNSSIDPNESVYTVQDQPTLAINDAIQRPIIVTTNNDGTINLGDTTYRSNTSADFLNQSTNIEDLLNLSNISNTSANTTPPPAINPTTILAKPKLTITKNPVSKELKSVTTKEAISDLKAKVQENKSPDAEEYDRLKVFLTNTLSKKGAARRRLADDANVTPLDSDMKAPKKIGVNPKLVDQGRINRSKENKQREIIAKKTPIKHSTKRKSTDSTLLDNINTFSKRKLSASPSKETKKQKSKELKPLWK